MLSRDGAAGRAAGRAEQHDRGDLTGQTERARTMGAQAEVTVHPHDGHAQAADRRTARQAYQPRRVMLLPTGPNQPRRRPTHGSTTSAATPTRTRTRSVTV